MAGLSSGMQSGVLRKTVYKKMFLGVFFKNRLVDWLEST
jgi:hypothetical protein